MSIEHLGSWVSDTKFRFNDDIPGQPGLRAVEFATIMSVDPNMTQEKLESLLQDIADGQVSFNEGRPL